MRLFLLLLGVVGSVSASVSASVAAVPAPPAISTQPSTAPAAAPSTPGSTPTRPSTAAPTPSTAAPAPGSGTGAQTTPGSPAPEVQGQSPQATSRPAARTRHASDGEPAGEPGANGAEAGGRAAPSTAAGPTPPHGAPSPSSLTPPLPGSLTASGSGVPDFFIESFRVPPFLLPIYQAAGAAYGIPWQVLAAINEVETDYGRDLSVSSAGAEGWMQFLPSSWAQWGVDANGDGFADPYNPADAIFAAARYLRAAGGAQNIAGAVFAYNHSQAYVASVMLRARLLGGIPQELLNAITVLAQARFPVHAPSHFGDGFPALPGRPGRTLPGTVIYTQAGAPVIAARGGRVIAIGDSRAIGRYVSVRDAWGNVYTYGDLGEVAALYPVLKPLPPRPRPGPATHGRAEGRARIAAAIVSGALGSADPSLARSAHTSASAGLAPASAGVQPRSPLTEGAVRSDLAMGAAAALESLSAPSRAGSRARGRRSRRGSIPRVFRAGAEVVHLYPLRVGVHVIAGTILGHVGPVAATAEPTATTTPTAGATPGAVDPSTGRPEPHVLFQIRPAGPGAPEIDPKPILDDWVALGRTSTFGAAGQSPFHWNPPHLSPATRAGRARIASATSALAPGQWIRLIARLAEIPGPTVSRSRSTAAIPDAGVAGGSAAARPPQSSGRPGARHGEARSGEGSGGVHR